MRRISVQNLPTYLTNTGLKEGVSATIFAVEKFSYKFSVISVSYNVSTATHDLT